MSDRTVGTVAAATAAALFGSSYVATAFQLHGFTPLGAALARSALAAATLLVIVAARSRRARASNASGIRTDSAIAGVTAPPTLSARLGRLLVIGALGGFVFVIGMNVAVSRVGPTITSFVAGLYAITAALFAPVVLGERLERRAVVGFVVALGGTALLAELGPSPSVVVGLLAGGIAAVSFGLYLVLVRRWSRAIDVGPAGISLAAVAVSTIGLTVLLGIVDPRAMLPTSGTSDVIVSTVWLAAVAVVGPLLTTVALRRIEAGLVSSMLLLNPITATALAAILLRERPSLGQLAGGVLVLAGMALATDLRGAIAARRRIAAAPPPP